MNVRIFDLDVQDELIRDRQISGLDRHDEVWDGVYVIMPLPNIKHQGIVNGLAFAMTGAVQMTGLGSVYPGVNVSDRDDDWRMNYRCPDVAVYLAGNPALDCGTHWRGGPDFAVEITSPHDQTRGKLDFYAGVGVRELLVLDRDPWCLELYRIQSGSLTSVGRCNPDEGEPLGSEVLPLRFRLVQAEGRSRIEVRHADGRQTWLV